VEVTALMKHVSSVIDNIVMNITDYRCMTTDLPRLTIFVVTHGDQEDQKINKCPNTHGEGHWSYKTALINTNGNTTNTIFKEKV